MKKYVKYLLVLLVLTVCTAALCAADITVRASVNKTALTLDDELTLSVIVDGASGNIMPQLPSMPAFNVYSRSTSTQIYNSHATTIFEYIMTPRFPGATEIGPISVTYKGKTYTTDPIAVTIYRTAPQTASTAAKKSATTQRNKAAAPSKTALQQAPADMPPLERSLYNQAARKSNQSYFMVAAVSDRSPYANQTFTLAVRFYYSRPFSGSAPYTAPAITNLFLEEIGRSDGQQMIGGMLYDYIEIRYGATGVTPGEAQIGPASIKYIPLSQRNISLFRMFTVSTEDQKTIQSDPITITINPVPTTNQPASFYGAVGSGFTIQASVDRAEVEAGDAINLIITVKGPGNLKPTRDLKLPSFANFKAYDVVSSAGVVAANGSLQSYKNFKTVLVALSSGNYTIPALDWSYYDPALQEYRTLRTQPLTVEVTPSSAADSGFDFRSQTDIGSGIQTLHHDIRYLQSKPFADSFNWLTQIALLDWISLAALLWLLTAALLAWIYHKTPSSQRALLKARSLLKKATQEEDIANALSVYLQIKYDIHTASCPVRQIQEELKNHGCSADQILLFSTLWQQLEAARFAPVALHNKGCSELIQQALQLLTQLDKGARK